MKPSAHVPLFTRFETDEEVGLEDLARDLTDILGARRVLAQRVPGVLNWGLPGLSGLAPSSQASRERLAGLIAELIEQFEPRLEQVRVIPDDDTNEFTFRIEAMLIQPEDRSVTLRVLSPRKGGGLGAEVTVLGSRETGESPGN